MAQPATGSPAAEAAVAPVLRLTRSAHKAQMLKRHARALEQQERALAAAESGLPPHESLVVARLLASVAQHRLMQAPDIWTSVQSPGYAQRVRAAWHHDAQMLSLSQRAMALLLARARAGTLLAPTATEVAFFTGEKLAHAQTVGAHLLLGCAEQAVFNWPPLGAPAEEEARLQGVASALRAALQLDASGELQRGPRFEDCGAMTLVLVAECDKDHTAGGLLHQLRVMTGGLSPAEWTALYELALRLKPAVERHHANAKDMIDAVLFRTLQQRAAADVARHGLRRCALPSCDVTEPHPQAHKLCSGCRGVVYCCKAHQVEDRRRHKRAETCQDVQPAAAA